MTRKAAPEVVVVFPVVLGLQVLKDPTYPDLGGEKTKKKIKDKANCLEIL